MPHDLKSAYEQFLHELGEAAAIFEEDQGKSQVMAVAAAVHFLNLTGNTAVWLPLRSLLESLIDAALHKNHGGAHRPINETYRLATAAAAVSVLGERCTPLDSAVSQICTASGLEPEAVRKFRNDISRKRVSGLARSMYETILVSFRADVK